MEYLIPLLIVLFILLVLVTLVGHGIWIVLAWFFREVRGSKRGTSVSIYSPSEPAKHQCRNCGCVLEIQTKFCGVCGAERLTLAQEQQLRELEVTLRQLERLHQTGAQDQVNFRVLKTRIENERERTFFPRGRPGAANQPSLFTAGSGKSEAPHKPVQTARAAAPPF